MAPPVSHFNAFIWGQNVEGCLGLGDAVPVREYVRHITRLNTGESGWTQIACGLSHTVGLSPNGEVFTWAVVLMESLVMVMKEVEMYRRK